MAKGYGKWRTAVLKEREKTSSNYQKGKALLIPILEKYNFDLSTQNVNGSHWTQAEKTDFIKGMKLIGYKEDVCKWYNVTA